MTGQHIQKLLKATATSDHEKLKASRRAWNDGYDALFDLAENLKTTALEVERGFADGVATDVQGTAARGRMAFETLREDVVIPRRDQMKAAGEALRIAAAKLKLAELARDDMPDSAPGDLPPRPSSYGTEDAIDAIRAQRAYDNQVTAHNSRVSAYANADEKARVKLQELDEAYVEASAVLAKIHGEPVYPEDLPPPGDPGPGGLPVGPSGGPRPIGDIPIHHPINTGHPDPIDTDHGPGHEPGPGTDPDHHSPGPVGGTLGNPGSGPGSGGGGGLGFNPIVGGGIAAGVFGGPGLVNAVRGALGGRGGFGSTNGTIGSTTRTGGAATLGRSGGGAAPGTQAGRSGGRSGATGGGRSGAGGRGGGAPGTAGGRGRGGGRGVAGAGAGGRGRKGRDEDGRERDLFDDGSDWLDDEGAGPDVLG